MTRKITLLKTATATLRMLCCLMLMLGLWTTNTKATVYTIGTGVTTSSASGVTPFTSLYEDNRIQYVYLASELTAAGASAGNIVSVAFNFTALGGPSPANVNISMGATASTTLSALVSGLSVYASPGTVTPVVGYNTYTLSTPFSWNGTSNIVVEVCRDNAAWSGNYTVQTTQFAAGDTRTFGYYTDAVAGCSMTTGSSATAAQRRHRPNIKFDIVSASPCAGTPTPGNTISSANPVCSGANFTLSLQNATSGTGVTYQWQSADDAGFTINLTNLGTSTTQVTSQTTAKYYRCNVTCSAGPSTGTSNSLQVTMNAISQCYCRSTYTYYTCDAINSLDFVTSVAINTLNNVTGSTCPSTGNVAPFQNWTFFSSPTTTLTVGTNYTATIGVGSGGSEGVGIWIDYNQNGSFLDAGEFVGTTSLIPASTSGTLTVSVPPGALAGSTVMRVQAIWNLNPVTQSALCGAYGYGEQEDYAITIAGLAPCSGTPTPGNTVTSSSSVCAGGASNLSLQFATSGTGVTYQWFNSGGSIPGATMDTYTTPALFAAETYHCDVTCSAGPSTGSSGNTTINIVAAPVGGTASGPTTGVTYQNLTYNVIGTTGSLQWQFSTDNITFTDIAGSTNATLNVSANAGGTYYIRCKAYNAGCTDAFSNVITLVVSVAGDNVCSANVLTLGNNGPYSNAGATGEVGEVTPPGTGCNMQDGWCSTGYAINSVWFTFTPAVSGQYSFGANFNYNVWDNELAIYSAAACSPFGGFTLIAANDDSLGSPYNSYIAPVCLTGGTTYYVLGDGYSAGTNTSWGIRVTKAANVAPVIAACPANITQCNDAGLCSAVASWSNPTATDDCGGATVVCSPASGSSFNAGSTTVTCTATDIEGATSACSFSVTINDCEAPVITVPAANMTVECDGTGNTADFNDWLITNWADADATDNCTDAAHLDNYWVNDYTSFNYTCGGNVGNSGLVTFRVYDGSNNYSLGTSATFTIVDTQAPVIGACPGNITQCDNTTVTWTNPSVTDVCGATVVCSPASGSTFPLGTSTVTCTATDCGGNTDACSFTVTINTSSTAATSATSNALYGQVCSPGSVTLTANGGSLGTGGQWVWYDGGCGVGASVGSGSPLTVTPSVGSHNYFVRAEGACPATACQNVAVNSITAPPSNTIHYTAGISDGCVAVPAAAFTVNAVANCTFYNWSSTSAGVRFNGNPSPFQTTTPTVNVTFVSLPAAGTSGWSICVFGGNACGNTNTICTWVRATIGMPGGITGSTTGCPNSTLNPYSSAAVAGATSYQWSGTAGITINGNGAQSVTVDFGAGFVSGTLSVHGQSSCGYNGPDRNINITRAPATPGVISGASYPCPNSAVNAYSVAAVPGAATYTWSTSVAGAIVTGTSNSCNIQFPAVIPGGSTVSVVANSSCPFSSAVRSKGIGSGIPIMPGGISGPASGQCGASGVSYSITPVLNATGYNWSVSCGTIAGPANLSGVSVNWPGSFTTCSLSVSASNICGTGPARTLAVAGAPGIPGVISGNAAPCANAIESYSTPGSAGATSYNWFLPAGAVILGPSNGSSILVQWGATSGNITVSASNACGTSAVRTLACVISCRMSQMQSAAGSFNAEVYPNPASDKATVKFTAADAAKYHLNMTDVLGQHVLSLDGAATEGINMVELNLGSLAKGVYLLSIMSNGNTEQIRVVIQ